MLYFSNPGDFDLRALTIMGISAKPTEGAIGYFGTGLKYAIATLLRTGHKVSLQVKGQYYNFSTRPTTFRGKDFQAIYLTHADTDVSTELPFTTDLGKNWEVWMAYRELRSNAQDEGGLVSSIAFAGDVVFEVDGHEIVQIHNKLGDSIFLPAKGAPDYIAGDIQIWETPSNFLYYKGVRVLEGNFANTYNFINGLTLTEDRTVSVYQIRTRLSASLPKVENETFALRTLTAKQGTTESELFWTNCDTPNPIWVETASAVRHQMGISQGVRDFANQFSPVETRYKATYLTYTLQRILKEAFAKVRILLPHIDHTCVTLVDDLDSNYGLYDKKTRKIYISMATVRQGGLHLAATLYEEFLHRDFNLNDHTRELQDHILQDLFFTVANLQDARNAQND